MTAACPACAAVPIATELATSPTLQFSLPTIHCSACIGKIERGMRTLKGVNSAHVNLSLKRLSIEGPIDPDAVQARLTELGFEAYPLDPEALAIAKDKVGQSLLLRVAVSGFAMMNVMLLSVAVWSGATDATRDLFHLISACIAIPVVAYAAQPFFENALTALRVGRLNMDVPISLAIILATGMSIFETLHGGEHAYFDAAISLTFFLLIGRYLDHQTRAKARSAAKELAALEVPFADRVVDGKITSVKVASLQVGDIVAVPSGARVPVDGQLVSDAGLTDRSLLTGESNATALQRHDVVQSGEVNLGSPFKLKATAVGPDTTLRRIAAMVETAETSRNSYTALADRAASIYAPLVHILAALAFIGWWVLSGDLRLATNIAIAVLIITCPCALGLAVPAVSTASISRLFSAGYLVKHATALDRLADITHVVLDKTGTLTRPMPPDLSALTSQEKSVIKSLAQQSLHPISQNLSDALKDAKPIALTDLHEEQGNGMQAMLGAQQVRLGRGAWLGAPFQGLGFSIGTAPAKLLDTSEQLREGTSEKLSAIDLPCSILTGDVDVRAQAVSETLGLPVISSARPEDKVNHLRKLARSGAKVLMVGDGLNDTPALAEAHASLAPATALEASRSAADVVALNPRFPDIGFILATAVKARKLSKQNFGIAAAYNLVAIPIALLGFATPLMAALAMSLSSITVLLNSQRMRSKS